MNEKKKDFRIYLKGEDKTDAVRNYRRVGNTYEVTFNSGKIFNYNIQNVKIVGPRECFSYLKRIADEVGLEVEIDGKTINILSINYSKIKTIPPDSILEAFVSGNQLSNKVSNSNLDKIVYPFGFNISQQDAVRKAFASPLSIIQGPPGTGKTQTILNIIANAIMRGKSVAVVSSNNSATKNVYEKLQKNGFEFVAAFLGNNANKADFIADQKPIPELKDWTLSSQEHKKLLRDLDHAHKNLQNKLIQQQELSVLKQQLSEVEIEKKHFLFYGDQAISNEIQKLKKSQEALEMWLLCETENLDYQKSKFFIILKRIFNFLLFNRRKLIIGRMIKKFPAESLITSFQKRFYDLKIQELEKSISELTNQLDDERIPTVRWLRIDYDPKSAGGLAVKV